MQLLIECARAFSNTATFAMSDAAGMAEICNRVDGIPLAIEFAAARLEVLGVEGVASQLKQSLALLTTGRRTALPRHRTLSATLDWSYQLLQDEEQALLRALAVFHAPMTLEAAAAVALHSGEPSAGLLDSLAGLVAKSLLVVDRTKTAPRYRLLEATRDLATSSARLSSRPADGSPEWRATAAAASTVIGAWKTANARSNACSCVLKQLIAPVQCRAQRPMAGKRSAAAGGDVGQALFSCDATPSTPRTSSLAGGFDRRRNPVDPIADLRHSGGVAHREGCRVLNARAHSISDCTAGAVKTSFGSLLGA